MSCEAAGSSAVLCVLFSELPQNYPVKAASAGQKGEREWTNETAEAQTKPASAFTHLWYSAHILGVYMDRLWTPWRYSYVTRSDTRARAGVPAALNAWPPAGAEAEDKHCVFCNMIAAVDYGIAQGMSRDTAEEAAYIVDRGEHCFVCLNAYPYSTGHVMIVPYQHLDSLAALPPSVAQELMELAQRAELTLRQVYKPGGLNMGLNLGEAAGAGIADHIHLHVLPRWTGDTNFMTVTAETRVLPEPLDVTLSKLRPNFKK
jgi:ATP adenylyltransferase